MNPVAAVVLALAVAASFSSRIELVAAAAATACLVVWVVDRQAWRRVVRVGLVLGAVFAAAVAAAAVAWSSGLERGLTIGATVLLRLVVLGSAAAVLARSVDADTVSRAAARLGMERLGLVFGLALNALPHLAESISVVWSAHRIRSGGRWTAVRRLPALAEVLLAHTGRIADQAAAAAALRGHTALTRPLAPLVHDATTVIVTGSTGCGKTPLVASVVEALVERGVRVGGFVQPAVIEDGRKVGFMIRDVATGETAVLAKKVGAGAGSFGTSFEFAEAGFELARAALGGLESGSVAVVDELGPLELRGGGHWPAVQRLLTGSEIAGLLVVVRRTLVPALIEALDAGDVVVVDLENCAGDPVEAVTDALAPVARSAGGTPHTA